jgi:hypothetical protein
MGSRVDRSYARRLQVFDLYNTKSMWIGCKCFEGRGRAQNERHVRSEARAWEYPGDSTQRLRLSNRLRIDGVVLLVRADEPDVHHPTRVINPHDGTLLVATDIDHHAAVLEDARVAEVRLYVARCLSKVLRTRYRRRNQRSSTPSWSGHPYSDSRRTRTKLAHHHDGVIAVRKPGQPRQSAQNVMGNQVFCKMDG